ncbi:MAG TPA: efflux RND transporter periplasmic adaptor subunit [Isosphaeraceae bacterium]|nr:efflux RND transporter periplasmic adaptor subunit [Isosphaeraceae bacterium]
MIVERLRAVASRWVILGTAGVVVAAAAAVGLAGWLRGESPGVGPPAESGGAGVVEEGAVGDVALSAEQQRAIGLRVERVALGETFDVLTATGRVVPNELHFAYITPRAAGVIRSVNARVGQEVRAGDLLATIDSPDVAEARLDLYTKVQAHEVALTQADWESTIYRNTIDLVDLLKRREQPEAIHREFESRPVGQNREKLLTAYAQFRLAEATMTRNRGLFDQQLITPKQFQRVTADHEAAVAAYQGLIDQMEFDAKLANTRAQQALRQAETAVRVARERLRILGVKDDGTEPEVRGGKVVGVRPDGTLPEGPGDNPADVRPEKILPGPAAEAQAAVKPPGSQADAAESEKAKDRPVGTYSVWAPFDGTILEREQVVPGISVGITHRLFTLADLSTVWVEVNVHEGDFGKLPRGQGARVRFRSDAYPGRDFDGEVIYAGDLVDEKSRAVLLLARAKNPGRLLKPGMFVEVEVYSPASRRAASIPRTALLTEGDRTFVFVRKADGRFERRDVVTGAAAEGKVAVLEGLEPGEDVVVEGGFKLKAEALRLASS